MIGTCEYEMNRISDRQAKQWRGPRRRVVQPASHCRSGMTLLEVTLSLGLIILMMGGVWSFYTSVLRARKEGIEIPKEVNMTRTILNKIAGELRQAVDVVPGDGKGFRGEKRSITIVCARMPDLGQAYEEFDEFEKEDRPPAQMDLKRVSYQLLWDTESELALEQPICHGLYRTEQRTFDPNPSVQLERSAAEMEGLTGEGDYRGEEEEFTGPQPEGEIYAREIKFLRFRYYDGVTWHDTWQVQDESGGVDTSKAALAGKEAYALPQAVEITIGREPLPMEIIELELEEDSAFDTEDSIEEEEGGYYPDRRSIVVYLPLSDRSLLTTREQGIADTLSREDSEEGFGY